MNIHNNIPSNLEPELPSHVSVKSPNNRWRLWWIVLGALIVIFLLWLYQINTNSKPPYYIALTGPMQTANGQAMREGVQMLINQVNAQTGIDHHPLKLLIFDDQDQVDIALQNAQRLVKDDRILGIIGHSASGISSQMAPIYAEAGIPAITATATADNITEQSEWYFRTIFTNTDQASLLANYALKVLGYQTANMISVDSMFGDSLAQGFLQAAQDIRLQVNHHWQYEYENPMQREAAVNKLLATYQETGDNSILFIATGSSDAVKILTRLRSLNKRVTVIGPDSFASNNLQILLKELPQERAQPGYYTEDIYITSPFLDDVANQKAQIFKYDYTQIYGHEPSTTAALNYDAALTLVSAMREISHDRPVSQQREQIKIALQKKATFATAVEGVTGEIYFDKKGDVIKAIHVAQFKSGKMTVALEQFQPIVDLTNIGQLLEEALHNQVIYINGKFMRRANVVYSGIDFNEISELDVSAGTYIADFYLWFRFHEKFDFDDQDIEFINGQNIGVINGQDTLTLDAPFMVEQSKLEANLITKAYRVKAQFKAPLDFHEYPLDRQILPIQFRHNTQKRDRLIYVVDGRGMNLSDQQNISEKLKAQGTFNMGGWELEKILYFQDIQKTDSSLGIPELFNMQKRIEYSRFNVNIQIKRNVLNFILKNLIPIIFLILLGYVSYYLSGQDALEIRLSLSVNMIIATSLFHLKWANSMANVDYLVLMEYLYFSIYLLALFNIAIITVFYYKDVEKDAKFIQKVNIFGKIFYVVFLGAICVSLIYYS